MAEEKKDEIKKKKNGRSIDWEVDMQVCYVPLPPERVAGWRHATLLLLELIYPVLCKAGKNDPGEFPTLDDIPEI